MNERCAVVSRETGEVLRSFVDLLLHWNARLNLISRRDAPDLWRRHVFDSAQLASRAPISARTWLDLGSGAGFPGLICAAILRTLKNPIHFTLVEADGRKAAFLREAVRQLQLDVDVLQTRIEQAPHSAHDVISARGLASLDRLIGLAEPFCHSGTRLLFPKGRRGDSELTLARRAWHIRAVRVPSCTDPDGTILELSEVRRRP